MLQWEDLKNDMHESWHIAMFRAKVPGGWLVMVVRGIPFITEAASVTFMPDPHHQWDGKSLR